MAHTTAHQSMFLRASTLLAGEAEHFADLAAQYRAASAASEVAELDVKVWRPRKRRTQASGDEVKRPRGRPRLLPTPWTEDDIARFREATTQFGFVASKIHKHVGTHTMAEVKQRMSELLQAGLSAMGHGVQGESATDNTSQNQESSPEDHGGEEDLGDEDGDMIEDSDEDSEEENSHGEEETSTDEEDRWYVA